MRTTIKLAAASAVLAIVAADVPATTGPAGYEEPVLTLRRRRLNGPRLGVSYVLQNDRLDRDGTMEERIKDRGMDVLISQFGWHFEWIVAPEGGGPAFVTELLPFFGGVEYGKVIPSLSLVLGIRMPMGFEFGMGPNVLTTFDADEPVITSLVVAIGQSIKFGDVQIPLNLALLTNKGGNRLSFVFGYAMPELRKRR
jgi:hypothetical protein